VKLEVKELDISSNKIKMPFVESTNPDWNAAMPSIVSLNISDNPLTSIPQAVTQLAAAMPNLQDL
jgi:Leucine-rich repeat (LRR) protein